MHQLPESGPELTIVLLKKTIQTLRCLSAEQRNQAEQLLCEMADLANGEAFSNNAELKTSQWLVDLTPEDLGHYHYFALYGFGRYAQSVAKHELDLIRSMLSNQIEDKCLKVADTELDATPSISPLITAPTIMSWRNLQPVRRSYGRIFSKSLCFPFSRKW